MKRIFLIFLTTSVYLTASAQISFNTGSADFDADLNIINTNAKADLSGFKTDMTVSFGVSIGSVDKLLANMVPGEVYLALEIVNSTGKSIDDVIVSYNKNKGKGWGVIAQEMGIKPGSDQFHALKGKASNKKGKGNNGNGNGKNK